MPIKGKFNISKVNAPTLKSKPEFKGLDKQDTKLPVNEKNSVVELANKIQETSSKIVNLSKNVSTFSLEVQNSFNTIFKGIEGLKQETSKTEESVQDLSLQIAQMATQIAKSVIKLAQSEEHNKEQFEKLQQSIQALIVLVNFKQGKEYEQMSNNLNKALDILSELSKGDSQNRKATLLFGVFGAVFAVVGVAYNVYDANQKDKAIEEKERKAQLQEEHRKNIYKKYSDLYIAVTSSHKHLCSLVEDHAKSSAELSAAQKELDAAKRLIETMKRSTSVWPFSSYNQKFVQEHEVKVADLTQKVEFLKSTVKGLDRGVNAYILLVEQQLNSLSAMSIGSMVENPVTNQIINDVASDLPKLQRQFRNNNQ